MENGEHLLVKCSTYMPHERHPDQLFCVSRECQESGHSTSHDNSKTGPFGGPKIGPQTAKANNTTPTHPKQRLCLCVFVCLAVSVCACPYVSAGCFALTCLVLSLPVCLVQHLSNAVCPPKMASGPTGNRVMETSHVFPIMAFGGDTDFGRFIRKFTRISAV